MAAPKRDNARAARALIEAHLHGDRKACESQGITDRTLRNYRAALSEDPELSALFLEHLRELTRRSWAEELDATLSLTVRKLAEHIAYLEPGIPDSVEALTDAFRALSETAITREVLRAGDSE